MTRYTDKIIDTTDLKFTVKPSYFEPPLFRAIFSFPLSVLNTEARLYVSNESWISELDILHYAIFLYVPKHF